MRDWFRTLGAPTPAQVRGWPPIASGASTLLLAPTGSGKTLAAFLAAIDRLLWSEEPPPLERCRVLYVSPLKALAVDIERNLRAPLAGISQIAREQGETIRAPKALVRTGDTPQIDRARMRRSPPDILITTPESLYLVLTSGAAPILRSVETVILDEIHALVPTKRGAHLMLSLERLEELRGLRARPLQRIGLSATQKPLDEVARFLGGFEPGAAPKPRAITVVDASHRKSIEVRVQVPEVDLGKLGLEEDGPAAREGEPRRSIWPHLHETIAGLVRAHRSTMVFVNSRRLAERLASALNEVAGEEIALAHHGSVAREKRAQIEERLKRGELPAIVATSSLELGIDMGAVDLVIQVEAPPSVASGLQRIGRAGHSVGETSQGVILPKHRGDLLAAAAAAAAMRAGEVEEMFYPRNALDVLAQQVVATVASEACRADALYSLVRRAAPFAELPRAAFDSVLDMLSGRYPSRDFAELRPRITWDRTQGTLRAREGVKLLAVTSGGTIPDRGLYGVFLLGPDGEERGRAKRVGELDEEMVFELREGEVFLLGASSWRAERITLDRVLVLPAAGQPGKMPFWHGDRPGRPLAFGAAVGRLTRALAHDDAAKGEARLRQEHGLDASASHNLLEYVRAQRAATGEAPSDRVLVLERFVDELGDFRVCLLSPFGARVHAPWATAILARLHREIVGEVEAVWSDDGMAFRIPASSEPPPLRWFLPSSAEVEGIVTAELGGTALFAARFREAAARALLLPRRRPGQRTPLWAQRKRAGDMLAVAAQYPSFPILLETYRECLRDVFDLPGLVGLLRQIEERKISVVTADTRAPSPFASTLLFSFVANFIYDADAPLAERRAQALTIDHARLRELLGEAELRTLLDADVIAEHERSLQRLVHPAKHPDALHDVLLSVGDLTSAELAARCEPSEAARDWIAELVSSGRAIEIEIAGDKRYAAAEDAGRYRDAFHAELPPAVPEVFLEHAGDPAAELLGRYARTHGPFTAASVEARFGVGRAIVQEALVRLAERGKVEEGEFLPRGRTREYCDVEVLRALRRKSLAKLRKAVEPVDDAAYARLQIEWQLPPRRGPDALLDAVRQLEGCPLPVSVLESEILPARVEGFRPWDLDALCASGEVVWAGVEALGESDGRIALYVAEHEPLLTMPAHPVERPLALRLRELLERRGAVFFADIAREMGGFSVEIAEALWELVWAGVATNDTLEPLRSLLRAAPSERERVRPGRPRVRPKLPGTEGRWSLRAARGGPPPPETDRRAAAARMLLERYGVLTKEAVQAEAIPGGFAAVYDVLRGMEDAGRVRRGYFVAGRGALQFAVPGAEDRLRLLREPRERPHTVVLAATDPANPYGGALPWPGNDGEGARPQRAAGALVVLHEGALLGWLSKTGQNLLTFLPDEEPAHTHARQALAGSLAGLVEGGRRKALLIVTIDGDEARRSPLAPSLVANGFSGGTHGLLKRRSHLLEEGAPKIFA